MLSDLSLILDIRQAEATVPSKNIIANIKSLCCRLFKRHCPRNSMWRMPLYSEVCSIENSPIVQCANYSVNEALRRKAMQTGGKGQEVSYVF